MRGAVGSGACAHSRHKEVFVVRTVKDHHWLAGQEESVLKLDLIAGIVEDLSGHPNPCYLLKARLVD